MRAPIVAAVVAAVAAVAANRADARRVVHIPTLGELCPGNADWAKVEQCIRRHGPLTFERNTKDVKLVRLGPQSRIAGIALYVHDKTWRLRGELRLYQEHELLGFQRATYGRRGAYRIDLGTSSATNIQLADDTLVLGVLRHRLALECFDDGGCLQAMTGCEALVHGKAVMTFRGRLVHEDGALRNVGDRRQAGALCSPPELVVTD